MRFVWSLPLVFLAFFASQTPAEAVINRLGDALSLSGSCDGAPGQYTVGEFDQAIATINAEMAREVRAGADVNPGQLVQLAQAAGQLHRCRLQQQYWDLILRAHLNCGRLKASVDGAIALMSVQAQIFGPPSQPFVHALLSNFQTAVKKCWAVLAAKCINLDNRSKAREAADLIRTAERVGLTRADLQPPLRPCTSTVPYCRPGEPLGDCTPYLQDVADILFGNAPPPAMRDGGFGGGPQ
jgi:hypothetical protein